MRKRISRAAMVMLVVAIPLEMILIASQENLHHRVGYESGAWAIRMGHDWASILSWVVTILIGIAFVIVWSDVRLVIMAVMIAAVFLVELLWVHDLPRPQNRWDLALAFLLGALSMFIQAVGKTDFVNNARKQLKFVWSH